MKVKCSKCEYVWDTNSEKIYVSCPSCMQKVKIRGVKKNGNKI